MLFEVPLEECMYPVINESTQPGEQNVPTGWLVKFPSNMAMSNTVTKLSAD